MNPIPLDDSYFERFSTKPVTLKPFDPQTKEAALALMAILDQQVAAWGIRSVLHGSTALELEGKGEIEVVLYLDDETWEPIKSHLFAIYGQPYSQEENFVNINTEYRSIEVEIILVRGHDAEVNRALMDYLHRHPDACAEYVRIKRRYASSRREYYRQKHLFFCGIIEQL
jgi:GrpB-like predicted nucleotidyltransferase (UPF0157 family)